MKNLKSERGQSLVELSISLVVLLYLLSGAVEFGILFFQYVQLRDAVQEGALYGSLNPGNATGITARVRGASTSPLDLNTITPIITAWNTATPPVQKALASACPGDGIRVEVVFTHQIFMPFMPALLGRSTIPLTATVTDTVLQKAATAVCP